MKRKIASQTIWILLLVSTLTFASNIQLTKASGTIFIRADGSIDPDDGRIVTNDTVYYNFTLDIYDSIVVERDNITIGGNGYCLVGNDIGIGLDLLDRRNVTVTYINITNFEFGIHLINSHRNNISFNNISSESDFGIAIFEGDKNLIEKNTLTDCGSAIHIIGQRNKIRSNNVTNCGLGIHIIGGNNNIESNVVSDNDEIGVLIEGGAYNTMRGNLIANNTGGGVHVLEASYSSIRDNDVIGNLAGYGAGGINMIDCGECWIISNNFIDNESPQAYDNEPGGNTWNFWMWLSGGNHWSDYDGPDVYWGQYQNETGSDGIGDIPYEFDVDNQDSYPFTFPLIFGIGPWDITGPTLWEPDGVINIRDVAIVAFRFGCFEGHVQYDIRADITGPIPYVADHKIDIRDIALVASHYGEQYW